jgi:hypothetical protein
MANRYENGDIKKLGDGRVVYASRIYPNIPLKDSDVYVVSQEGDRLDTIANQFYNDSSLWWIIATANNIHDAPLAVVDGTILRVPIDFLNIINKFQKQ